MDFKISPGIIVIFLDKFGSINIMTLWKKINLPILREEKFRKMHFSYVYPCMNIS